MNSTIMKGIETFLIGLAVVVVSSIIQGLSNYHPTGTEGTMWGIVGVAIIGGLRALLSWLIVKQNTPTMVSVPSTTSTPATTEPPTTTVIPKTGA